MAQYVEVATPRPLGGRETSDQAGGGAQDDIPHSLRRKSAYYLEHGAGDGQPLATQDIQVAGRSIATAYVPTLQERAQAVMKGRAGFCWELVNFAVSIVVFAVYVAELYDEELRLWQGHRAVEVVATAFFVADFTLQLFVASDAVQYLTSRYGIIDFLTIIPALVIWIVPGSHSRVVFVLRVLRVFRALRVLRLTQYIRFKKHGFEYELGVFVLSAVAVIFCAAGIFQELEAGQYLEDERLEFHNAFYFILVTISTIGYGDITPRTTLGHFFVIIVIVGVFTIVPHQVGKLNELAKRNYSWDKEYTPATKSSGHVIVSTKHLSLESALSFLQEFYHPSRGTINLTVIFLGEDRPPRALVRALGTEKYRHKACYLRGSLMNGADQRRAKLSTATSVFLLGSRQYHSPSSHQDAFTLLQALAVRSCAESCGRHIEVYGQTHSQKFATELSPLLLGSSANEPSLLKNLMLSRAVSCPGSITLISNLLHSAQAQDFRKLITQQQPWIHEYVDGMSHQVFPVIFSARFDFEKYEDVARNLLEKYSALLISVLSKKSHRSAKCQGSSVPTVRLAPFQTCIRQGDIGFVIAKTAAEVLRIVETYGYWGSNDSDGGRSYSFSSSTSAVRVSSENLLRRRSPRSRFRQSARASAVQDFSALFLSPAIDRVRDIRPPQHSQHLLQTGDAGNESTSKSALRNSEITGDDSNDGPKGDESRQKFAMPSLESAVRLHDCPLLERILERDHCRRQMSELTNHYVLCGGRLSDAMAIISQLKTTTLVENAQDQDSRTSQSPVRCVILTPDKPRASQLMAILEDDTIGISLLEGVFFVEGSSTRSRDLLRVGALNARSVLLLSQDTPFDDAAPDDGTLPTVSSQSEDESLADFAVISSLLAMEVAQLEGAGLDHNSPHANHRLRSSSRFGNGSEGSLMPPAQEPSNYLREIGQGLPIESVKVRLLERFPNLDPSVFDKDSDAIEETLKRYGSQHFDNDANEGFVRQLGRPENTIAVLQFASNVKFCSPVDLSFEDASSPFLSLAFAAGRVFISSVVDRILCQSFYNPYIIDVIEALAGGNSKVRVDQHRLVDHEFTSEEAKVCGLAGEMKSGTSTARIRQRQLCSVRVQEKHIDTRFADVFADLLEMEVLALGVFRHPNPVLGNALAFVYTNPCADTIVHANDSLFVLR